jgi:hypothetical protein
MLIDPHELRRYLGQFARMPRALDLYDHPPAGGKVICAGESPSPSPPARG